MNSGGRMLDRGSEWRRWDLHVHTPESALANHYGNWPSYIDALEAKGTGVSVIGITDYCSIEGYKRVVEAKAADRLSGFDLVIPNIEFRTHPEMGNGRAINLHILVDPEAKDAIVHIERCLGLLTFEYNGIHYPCSTQGLRSLGAAVDTSQTDEWGAFKAGVNAFKPDFGAVRRWLDNEGYWLRQNGLVVMANGKDGPSVKTSTKCKSGVKLSNPFGFAPYAGGFAPSGSSRADIIRHVPSTWLQGSASAALLITVIPITKGKMNRDLETFILQTERS